MKLSARNTLEGRIVSVEKGAITAHVRINVGGTITTSAITNAAVEELALVEGEKAYAVMEASDVMTGTDGAPRLQE